MPIFNSGSVGIHGSQAITLALPKQFAGSSRTGTSTPTLMAPYANLQGRARGYAIHEGLGAQLLYKAATGLEKAMADADAERLIAIQAELVKETWDPYECPAQLLPYLAWAMGVNFWNDNWSETTKRSWIAAQWQFKSLRGTADAIAMAVNYAGRDVSPFGYELLSVVTQPQKIYPGPSLSADERLAWIESLPQLRVYTFQQTGMTSPYKAFCGSKWQAAKPPNCYMNRFSTPSTAKERLGKAAYYYPDPTQPPADVVVVDQGSYYQIYLYGEADAKVFSGQVNTGKFFQPSSAPTRVLTIEPDSSSPHPIAVGPSLNAISAQPQMITIPGTAGYSAFCGSRYKHGWGAILGDGVSDIPTNRFFIPSTSKYRVYEEYGIFNPADLPPGVPVSAVSAFTGVGYMNWPKYTAKVSVFMAGKRSPFAASTEGLASTHKFLVPHDPGPMEYVCSAIEASRRLSDKILLSAGPFPNFVAGQEFLAGSEFIVGAPKQIVPSSNYQVT